VVGVPIAIGIGCGWVKLNVPQKRWLVCRLAALLTQVAGQTSPNVKNRAILALLIHKKGVENR